MVSAPSESAISNPLSVPPSPRNVTVPRLNQGEHVCLIGTTGSGKTVLAESFLSRIPYVVTIDLKHELKWRAFQVTESLTPILKASRPTQCQWLYRPRNREDAAAAIDALFRQKGWTIFVDEVYGLSRNGNGASYPESFIRSLTRGRSRGITIWSGMQRPRAAPIPCFTESSHFFVFDLELKDDRKRVGEFTIPDFETLRFQRHWFGYYSRFVRKLVVSRPLRKEVR